MKAKDEIQHCIRALFEIQASCEWWKKCCDGSYEMALANSGIKEVEDRLAYLKSDEAKFNYLVRLRNSGATNMWGAGPYVAKEFGLTEREGSTILLKWIETFQGE
jgi:hypothetical protein